MSTDFLLAWVDIETTGLDPDDHVLEFAMVLTDSNLRQVAPAYTSIVRPTQETFDRIDANAFVRDMHATNGLIDALRSHGADAPTLDDIDTDVAAMVLAAAGPDTTVHVAGGGVAGFDLPLIKRAMPRLASSLHYRPIDVSLIASAYRMSTGGQELHRKATNKAHRALDDILEDLEVGRAVWGMMRSVCEMHPDASADDRLRAATELTQHIVDGDDQARHELVRSMSPLDLLGGTSSLASRLALELARERGSTVADVLGAVQDTYAA